MPHFAQFWCILSPLLAILANTLHCKSFPCRSYEKHRGGVAATKSKRPATGGVTDHGVTLCDFNGFRFIKFGKLTHVGAP
jgi:hypothetical protein